jgi:hypothetical protein
MSDLIWLKSKPFNNLADCGKVSLLFGFWVSIIITKITFSTVVAGESKIYGNSLAVTDV